MRVYVAGPMSGIPAFNIPAFDEAARRLRDLGYEVVSPAEVDGETTREVLLQSPRGDHADLPPSDGGWSAYLARDFKILADDGIDAIVCLPGWERSRGARCEVAVGEALGIPRRDFSGMVSAPGEWPDHADMSCDEARGNEHPGIAPNVGAHTNRSSANADLYDGDRFVPHSENPLRQRAVTGAVKDNRGKPQLELIPSKPLIGVGRVLEFGARKYKPNNWRLGLSWTQTLGSALRHLVAFADGEDLDPETGLPHIDQALCQVMFLSEFYHTETGEDDRWSSLAPEGKEASKA